MHHVVDFLQFTHANNLERCVDETPAEEVNGLAGVLAVSDVRSLDRLDTNDGLEDRCAKVRTSGETDGNDGPTGSEVLGGLLERLLVDSHQDDGVGPEAVLGGSLHVFDDVRRFGEVNEGMSAELLDHRLFFFARVNTDDLETHSFGILAGERAKASPGTNNGNRLARASVRLLQSLVDSDTCAEDRGDGIQGDIFGYSCDVCGFRDSVLLKRSVHCVAGEKGFGTERFVTCLAEITGQA